MKAKLVRESGENNGKIGVSVRRSVITSKGMKIIAPNGGLTGLSPAKRDYDDKREK